MEALHIYNSPLPLTTHIQLHTRSWLVDQNKKKKEVKIQAFSKRRETVHEILMSELPHVIILEIEKAVRGAIEPPCDASRIRDGDDSPVSESPFVPEEFLLTVCECPPAHSNEQISGLTREDDELQRGSKRQACAKIVVQVCFHRRCRPKGKLQPTGSP